MPGTNFSGSYLSTQTLSNPALQNPASVTGTISVTSGPALLGIAGTAWIVGNQGRVASTAGNGVTLASGGSVTNAASAAIIGTTAGVSIDGAAGSVTNGGSISATGAGTPAYGNGVALQAGGGVTNLAAGQITGFSRGVAIYNNAGTVVNQGAISGPHFAGVALSYGGLVSNAASGTIAGGYAGIYGARSPVTVVNYGTVSAGSGYSFSNGIALFADARITNAAGGTISGVINGIAVYSAAAKVVNAGTIAGTGSAGNAMLLAPGQTNLLVDDPGAVFIGTVDGGNAIGTSIASTLQLASASLQGTLSGLGTQFVNFAQVAIDPGASWLLSGANTIAAGATFTDRGTLALHNATMSDAGFAVISASAGPAAVAVVDSASAIWDGSGELVIGDIGGGALTISGQGSVSATALSAADAAATLGAGATGEGWLTLTDSGSAFTATGQLTVGQSGSGHVLVENQATLVTGNNVAVDATQGLDIGQAAGAAGDVTVTGSKSLLSNTGRFVVGDGGFGSLSILHGGVVATTPGIASSLAGAVIGAQPGANGSSVNVTGAGSQWQIASSVLMVGDAAAGSLAITAGGAVSAEKADIGVLAGGSGNVAVTGIGSGLSLTGRLIVGDAASGELAILNGASVSASNGDIGLNAGSTGNVDIEGAGSHLNIANDLNIGGAGVGVLTLGNGTELTVGNNLVVGANGVLNQFGGAIDPSTITIVSGGRQGGHGTSTASVLISNAGTLFASGGTETVITPLITAPSGKSGVLEIDAGGDMVLNVTSVDATQSVSFTDGTGILTIGTIGGFAASIVGVNFGDQIIVQGKSIASDSFNAASHTLTLFDGSSATIGTLQLGPSVDGSAILANGTGGLGVAPCFAAGTRISTERGEVAVEDLRLGDRVQVVPLHPHPDPLPLRGRGGGTRASPPNMRGSGERGAAATELPLPRSGEGSGWEAAQPIIWIGHRSVDCTRHPDPRKAWPVRIAAHAFGRNRPSHDLFLSPDHAIYVNDVLIPVKHLINGRSIVQIPSETVTYYHVELPQHAVLLADNLPAESYLDTNDRANFANGSGPVALYPDFASRAWDARGCAPLVVIGPRLDATRLWLNAVAILLTPTHDSPVAATDEMLPSNAPRTVR